jgi:type II secretory pathway pseudopilin PulG
LKQHRICDTIQAGVLIIGDNEMRKFLSEQTGRSMIEMLGVLAIIGVLSVGGIAGYSKAMAKYKQNKIGDQVSMLITNIRTIYGNSSDYSGLSTASAIAVGAVDPEMENDDGETISHVYGGSVEIGSATITNSDDSFVIAVGGLPKAACVYLASADWGASVGAGWYGIGAASGTIPTDTLELPTGASITVDDDNATLPAPVTTAATWCEDSSGTNNYVVWQFR